MTNQQSAELPEPGVGSFHDPAALVAPQLAPIFVAPLLVVLPVRRDQFDASLLQSLAQRIGVVAAVGDHALRLLPRTAVRPGDADFGECGLRKINFTRRGTFQPNSQRKTLTVDQYHPLRALATLGFTDCGAPFFAGAKLPSRKVSSHLQQTLAHPVLPAAFAMHSARRLAPCHCCSRRQQVEGEGNSSGRNRHAAPVLQNPQNALQTGSIRGRRSASLVPCAASASEARAQSTPTARQSTASAASS